jgi:hypothetical protein
MIKYSFPMMLAGLAFMVNENFDKFIQRSLFQTEQELMADVINWQFDDVICYSL